jgi:hypothetical protein
MTQMCEAQVRHQPEITTIDLHGEINAFAEDALNEAYWPERANRSARWSSSG